MKTSRISRRPSILALAAACAFAGQPMSRAIDIAGDLLIELDAADFVNGSSVWTQNYSNRDPDTGILGDFTAFGNPTVQTVGGAMGVLFDGQDYFSGPLSTYLADPIDGPNPTRTIEVWVYQGNIRNEETLVSWGRRGAEGRNLSFNYGRSTGATGFGAVGQWGGGPDLGWNPGGVPAAGEWHHLVYTFGDGGSITKVYVDGLLAVSESTSVDTFPEYSINLGIQRSNSEGFPLDVRSPDVNNVLFSGAIGKVRIHSGALTDVEVLNNFEAEKSLFTAGVTASDVTRSPILRWSFNEASGDAFDGTSMLDEITGVSATIRGAGAIFTGSGVDLPGGNPNLQGYIDLPNGILSGKEALSIELWYTPQSRTGWSRVFDFGSGTGGEIGGPGGSFTAQNAVFLTQNSADTENQRLARRDGTEIYRDALGTTVYGEEVHVVMTYNPVVQEWQWYRNGILQEVVPDAAGPRTLADLNNWLGRSNFGTDQNTDAIYNEFRVTITP